MCLPLCCFTPKIFILNNLSDKRVSRTSYNFKVKLTKPLIPGNVQVIVKCFVILSTYCGILLQSAVKFLQGQTKTKHLDNLFSLEFHAQTFHFTCARHLIHPSDVPGLWEWSKRECTGALCIRVFHLPRLSPILLFKILKLCLTIKLTELKKIGFFHFRVSASQLKYEKCDKIHFFLF